MTRPADSYVFRTRLGMCLHDAFHLTCLEVLADIAAAVRELAAVMKEKKK